MNINRTDNGGEYPHIRACINSGIDPDDPDIFERYFGRKPTADEDQLPLDGGILEWWSDWAAPGGKILAQCLDYRPAGHQPPTGRAVTGR